MNVSIVNVIALGAFLWSCATPVVDTETVSVSTPWGTEVFNVPRFPEQTYSIVDFGAVAKKGANNQAAIQAAIDKCHEDGGGTVVIPAGTWETSFLEMRSNVNLRLDEGSVLFFSDDRDLYAVPTFTRWEGIECMNYHPLIYAKDEQNIAITGAGKIDGNGKEWWAFGKGNQIKTLTKLYDQVQQNIPPHERNCLAYEPTSYLRPSLIQAVNCKNVLVEGIEVGSGPMWTVHFVYCENVIARNLKVITNGVNNDGITPDGCNRVLIDNCFFSTGDDCIVIKSGLNEDGWRVAKPSQNIVIRNCRTEHGHGGIVFGSEMSGGIKNVYAYNCDFSHTDRGLRFKSMKGRGGILENFWFENIRMDSIVNEAIQINMHYGSSSIAPRTDSLPVFRNFHFKDITSSYAQYGIRMRGIEEQYIDQMTFTGMSLYSKYGIIIENARNSTFDSLIIKSELDPITIRNGEGLLFTNCRFEASADTLVRLTGHNEGITFRKTNTEQFKTAFSSIEPEHDQLIKIE